MRKNILFLKLILVFTVFLTNLAYCEDNFSSKNSLVELPVIKNNVSKKELKKEKKLKKEVSKSKKDKDLKPKDTKGYYGTLPDISGDFKYKQQTVTSSKKNVKTLEDDNYKKSELKEANTKDALFLDKIVKKEKTSNYVNDIQRTKFALQNLKKCIEENGNIQRFNGCVNVVNLYTNSLNEKYENKSESLKESFNDILSTNYYAKILGNLMYNANYYSQYVPTNDSEYSKENIESEKQKLLNRINRTLFLINEES